jgi:hypothetical protein
MKDEEYTFDYRESVQKRKGYRWPGVVVGRFHTLSGRARYAVECVVPEVKGALHIFSATDLKHRRDKR